MPFTNQASGIGIVSESDSKILNRFSKESKDPWFGPLIGDKVDL